MKKFDAIIIGGGHNGLISACYLANKQKNVLLLERRHKVGGAAVTEELYPGFRFSRFSYVCSLLRPAIINDLDLHRYGLKFHRRPISSITATKERGQYLLMNNDTSFTQKEISKFSKQDAENYPLYNNYLNQIIGLWNKYQDQFPVDPGCISIGNLRKKMDDLLLYKQIGTDILKNRKEVNKYIQFMTQSSAQFLDHWFESEILKGTLVTDGVIGEMVSIDQPASAYILLHHVMGEVIPESTGEWVFVEGGMGRITEIVEKIAKDRGVSIKTNCPVNSILSQNGKVNGVQTESGEIYYSDVVISNCTPKVTFNMISDELKMKDHNYFKRINSIEYNGACSKFNIAVKELPRFRCFEGTQYSNPTDVLKGTIHLGCESFESLRNGFKQVQSGSPYSKDLFIDMVIPSIHDKTIAPEGKHIIQCLVQYTPYNGRNWDENLKKQLSEHVFNTINEYAPNFKESVLFHEVLTPADIENILNMTEGNIFHGALTLDRLYSNRPANGYNSYQTPIEGLYLCGSGTHPGGGVMGAPGRNCANHILKYQK